MHELMTQTFGDATIEQFRDLYLLEHETTRKVLHAFPPDQADFKPHERSGTAKRLAWTFVIEELIMLKVLDNDAKLNAGVPEAPATWQEILDAFDEQHEKMKAKLASVDAASLNPVKFFVAPKQLADYAPLTFLFRFLCDQIHHRGQMSVYLRMVGAKVPSIYGPTADEPWT